MTRRIDFKPADRESDPQKTMTAEASEDATDAAPLYKRDLYAWAQQQVASAREGRLHELDLAHIAEELQDIGGELYDKLETAFRILLMHILKWEHQPERRTRSWEASIREQRRRIVRLLAKNPSLKSRQKEAIAAAYEDARDGASGETDLPVEVFPVTLPYSIPDIMERAFGIEALQNDPCRTK